MQKTKIEWCDSTNNCFWGCTTGCSYCAARKIARRFGEYLGTKRHYPQDTINKMRNFQPVFLGDQLLKLPVKPSRIFISFMGDPFLPEFEEYLPLVFETMKIYSQHKFIMLTKQPQNLIKWSPFPDNCWVGVSATNDKMYAEGLFHLGTIEAKVKFVSIEPLLGELNIDRYHHFYTWGAHEITTKNTLSWLIIGAQTQPLRLPPRSIVWGIIEDADEYKIPVFVKEPMASHYNIQRQEFPLANPIGEVK